MRIARLFGALALPVALAACVSFGGKAPPTLFSLTAAKSAPAGAAVTGKLAEAVVIAEPETDRRLAVQRVAVQIDDANVAYLKDAMWVERPARLFSGLIAETLRAKGGRLVFLESEAAGPGTLRLSGRLLEMGYDARAQSVVVLFDAIRSKGGEISTRRFEHVVSGVPAEAKFVGPALNEAANAVAAEVADWMG
jgi:cholesterol transport system auxiliary component